VVPQVTLTGHFAQNSSLAPWPAKTNPDNHPIRDEIDQEKVEHDKSAKCYRHDSDGLHSEENTPVARSLTGEKLGHSTQNPGSSMMSEIDSMTMSAPPLE
jgi:hypothetical protein